MTYFVGEIAEFAIANKLQKFAQSFGSNIKPFRNNLKRGFVKTKPLVNDYKLINNLTTVKPISKSKLKFQRTPLNPNDSILEKNMTNVKYHRRNFNLFMGEIADFKQQTSRRKKKVEREPRKVNNWEKAREIRSGIGTAQRVSQDVRGWLAYARMLKGG